MYEWRNEMTYGPCVLDLQMRITKDHWERKDLWLGWRVWKVHPTCWILSVYRRMSFAQRRSSVIVQTAISQLDDY